MERQDKEKPKKRSASSPKPRKVSEQDAQLLDNSALHAQIEARAYEIYERRIRQGPMDDWLQAEREILSTKRPTRKAT
jgi:hypothetical protein